MRTYILAGLVALLMVALAAPAMAAVNCNEDYSRCSGGAGGPTGGNGYNVRVTDDDSGAATFSGGSAYPGESIPGSGFHCDTECIGGGPGY